MGKKHSHQCRTFVAYCIVYFSMVHLASQNINVGYQEMKMPRLSEKLLLDTQLFFALPKDFSKFESIAGCYTNDYYLFSPCKPIFSKNSMLFYSLNFKSKKIVPYRIAIPKQTKNLMQNGRERINLLCTYHDRVFLFFFSFIVQFRKTSKGWVYANYIYSNRSYNQSIAIKDQRILLFDAYNFPNKLSGKKSTLFQIDSVVKDSLLPLISAFPPLDDIVFQYFANNQLVAVKDTFAFIVNPRTGTLSIYTLSSLKNVGSRQLSIPFFNAVPKDSIDHINKTNSPYYPVGFINSISQTLKHGYSYVKKIYIFDTILFLSFLKYDTISGHDKSYVGLYRITSTNDVHLIGIYVDDHIKGDDIYAKNHFNIFLNNPNIFQTSNGFVAMQLGAEVPMCCKSNKEVFTETETFLKNKNPVLVVNMFHYVP